MIERIPKLALVAGAIFAPVLLAYLAYSRPGYFTSEMYLGGLFLLEVLIAATWNYRQVYFTLVVLVFLFAGAGVPGGGMWTVARWLFLAAGAWVGTVLMLKDRGQHRFGLFHVLATFAVLAAVVSAAVSRYPGFALLKALSIFLLFLYGCTGARLAVAGRESRFFSRLLTGVELFVGTIGTMYFLGIETMGNPNSLGAVMGVVGAPILLWGVMLDDNPFVRRRRVLLYMVCMYLVFHSQARAGIAAAFISCGLMCLSLRKYRMLLQGLGVLVILIAASAIVNPEAFFGTLSSVTSSVVYKGRDPDAGLLASRVSPWQGAVNTIHDHFWFGTGFGTTENGVDASERLGKFETREGVSAENGSSYLAIATWVGMLGVIPFAFLLLALLGKILRTMVWMYHSESPYHAAVPLAMMVVAGLLHAAFEDWLFAPGYYLCVFFWSLAFVLVDVAPAAPLLPRFSSVWRPRMVAQPFAGVAPMR